MMSEFGAPLESAIFSQSYRPVPASSRLRELRLEREVTILPFAPSGYLATSFFLKANVADVFIMGHREDNAPSESVITSLLNQQTGRLFSSELSTDLLERMEAHYIITEGKEWVTRLLYTQRGLSRLLLDAVHPLQDAFGDRLIQLQGISYGDDVSLVATVQWQGNAESARAARNNFDQDWWLDNCNRAHGYLVFDYELADGV